MLTLVDTRRGRPQRHVHRIGGARPGTLSGRRQRGVSLQLPVGGHDEPDRDSAHAEMMKDVSSLFASAVRLARRLRRRVRVRPARVRQAAARAVHGEAVGRDGGAGVRLRARAGSGAPFALLCKVSTAACLASATDAITPLVALLAGGFINLGLDIYSCAGLGQGVAGVSAATRSSRRLVVAAALLDRPRGGACRRYQARPAPAAIKRRSEDVRALCEAARRDPFWAKFRLFHTSTRRHGRFRSNSTAAHRILMGLYWAFGPSQKLAHRSRTENLPGARRAGALTRRLLRVRRRRRSGFGARGVAALYCSGARFTADAAVVSRLRGLAPACGRLRCA